MARLTRTRSVRRDPTIVWRVMTDPARVPEWQRSVRSARVDPPAPVAIGSRLVQVRTVLGQEVTVTAVAIRVDPPVRIDVEVAAGPVRVRGGYRLREADTGCRVTFWVDLALPPLLARFAERAAATVLKEAASDLEALRDLCEAEPVRGRRAESAQRRPRGTR